MDAGSCALTHCRYLLNDRTIAADLDEIPGDIAVVVESFDPELEFNFGFRGMFADHNGDIICYAHIICYKYTCVILYLGFAFHRHFRVVKSSQ